MFKRKFEILEERFVEIFTEYKESLMDLMMTAAKTAKLWIKHPQMLVKKLIGLPEVDCVDMAKIKDFELMDGLFYMLPESVKKISGTGRGIEQKGRSVVCCRNEIKLL